MNPSVVSTLVHDWLYFAAAPRADEFCSIWWNQFLCWTAYLNVILLLATVVLPVMTSSSRGIVLPSGPGQSFWFTVHRVRPWLAAVYVLACGIRGVWPRMDELRICFYDHPISVVAVGRSLATIAELSFCAQICLAVLTITRQYVVANVVLAANVVAQLCCWYSVITQDQRGHTVEESIWLTSGLIWTVSCYCARDTDKTLSPAARLFRNGMLVAGPLYVLFMGVVDVPMYYNRYVHDTLEGREYPSVQEGLADILTCKSVSRLDSLWVPEMPWMTLYFTFAVWVSIWLAQAYISNDKQIWKTKKKK